MRPGNLAPHPFPHCHSLFYDNGNVEKLPWSVVFNRCAVKTYGLTSCRSLVQCFHKPPFPLFLHPPPLHLLLFSQSSSFTLIPSSLFFFLPPRPLFLIFHFSMLSPSYPHSISPLRGELLCLEIGEGMKETSPVWSMSAGGGGPAERGEGLS